MTIPEIGRDVARTLAASIEAATPEARTAAALFAGEITEAMADEFEDNLRAVEATERLIGRIGDTMVSAIERQKSRVVSAMQDLLSAAQDAYDAVLDGISTRFSEEDIRERISDAERSLSDARREAEDALQVVRNAPAAERAAQQQLDAAQKRLEAAEAAEKADSSELAAARQRLADAEDQLAEAKIGGVSDTGFFAREVEQARRALAEVERAEREREREATRAAEQAVADAKRRMDELRREIEAAQRVLADAPEDISDAERALRRANLQLFQFLAQQGVTPMGAGAAQTEMRRIGAAAGLTHDEMLQIAIRAVDIRNVQRRVDAAESGNWTNAQVREFAETIAVAIRESFPTAIHLDGNQLIGVIEAYLDGGTAP